jgi:glycine/D-amino acid oxidase-like deaminating enzyme
VTPDVEIAVVDAGLMGAATAWAATRRGRSVALLERFRLGHARGSAHGSARIVRRAYPDPLYARLTGRAMAPRRGAAGRTCASTAPSSITRRPARWTPPPRSRRSPGAPEQRRG